MKYINHIKQMFVENEGVDKNTINDVSDFNQLYDKMDMKKDAFLRLVESYTSKLYYEGKIKLKKYEDLYNEYSRFNRNNKFQHNRVVRNIESKEKLTFNSRAFVKTDDDSLNTNFSKEFTLKMLNILEIASKNINYGELENVEQWSDAKNYYFKVSERENEIIFKAPTRVVIGVAKLYFTNLSIEQQLKEFNEILILDLETTGLDPNYNEIMEIGAITVDIEDLEIENHYETLVKIKKPYTPIQKDGKNINDLTEELVNNKGIELEIAMKKLQELTTDKIVLAHNARFDKSMVEANYKKLGLKDKSILWLDTIEYFKGAYPEWTSYKLEKIINVLGIGDVESHRAVDDTVKTLECIKITHDSNKWNFNDFLKKGERVIDYNSRQVNTEPKVHYGKCLKCKVGWIVSKKGKFGEFKACDAFYKNKCRNNKRLNDELKIKLDEKR